MRAGAKLIGVYEPLSGQGNGSLLPHSYMRPLQETLPVPSAPRFLSIMVKPLYSVSLGATVDQINQLHSMLSSLSTTATYAAPCWNVSGVVK